MLDSGATNNFISATTCRDLGLKILKGGIQQNVKLADGKVLKVLGQVNTVVDFGCFQVCLEFEVVQADIPSILGMTFFTQVNPIIMWREKLLRIKCGTRYQTINL